MTKMDVFHFATRLKPSQIVKEFWGREVDFYTNFENQCESLPDNLVRCLKNERNLRFYDYAYGNPLGSNRYHFYELSFDKSKLNSKELKHFEENYQRLVKKQIKGDSLKACIQLIIQKVLKEAYSDNERHILWKEIKERYDYKCLCKGQGLFTSFFKSQTSSIEALEKWIEHEFPGFLKAVAAQEAASNISLK